MKKIGAVIITFNEQDLIRKCLSAVVEVADEVVVVDSFSTDATESICREFDKVTFLQRKWSGFSDQRNYANEHITADYILTLDADEVLSKEIQTEISDLKITLNDHQAFYFSRKSFYCGQWINHCGWSPDYQLRLFPRKDCSWDGAVVHEKITLPDHVTISKLKNCVYHYSYSSISDHISKMISYSQLGAEQLAHKSKFSLIVGSVLNPFLRFIKVYFLKLGFLDGYVGFSICVITGYGVFLKYFMASEVKRKTELL